MKSSKSVFTSPADIKYHGLINQGATCYLNSVLQVLFMTKDFREAVERCAPQNPECIDHHLKDVFDELLTGKSKTDKIRKKLGIRTVNERRDAAEYFEKILALTSSDASQIFHGELTHKIKCSNCREENNTDGGFWHLPLELVDSHSHFYSVVDGIKEYFQNSRLSGENQMYCDPCDAKSDATITCAMKHHPDVLTLLLKRFDFDYRHMSYVKNNRVVDVPSSLQIPENQTYELYAFVEHFGDLRGGHYTATIKSQDDERWYNFNDDSVTLLDKQPFQTGNTKNHPFRSWSVHLLFYKKKKTACSNGLCQPANRGDVPDRKGCNKNRQDLWDQKEARKHQIDKRKMMKVEEEGGKEAGAYASAENRGQFSIGTQQAQKCERGNQKPVWNKPQKVFIHNRSDREHTHEKEARNRSLDYPQVCVEKIRDKERIDKKEKRKYFKNLRRGTKHLKHEGLDKVDDDEGGKQGKVYTGQNKKKEDEKMEKDNKGRAGDRKRGPKGFKLGRFSRWNERRKQQNKERDEKQRRGGDEAAQRKRRSSSKSHSGEGSEDERTVGNGPEEKWIREKQNKGDTQCQFRQSGRRRQAENQGNSSAGSEEWDIKSPRGIEVKSTAKTPQDTSKNRMRIKRQSYPRLVERVTKDLSSMQLNESPSPEPQQRRAGNAQEDSETDAAPQSRGDHAKKQKKTQNDTCFFGCLPLKKKKKHSGPGPVSE